MPGRLKSFELHGYKTFASRTEFIFADGITAIVGPNGSGKSNVADALRWVLGEQSFGLLRAKKTEDMIFAGSEHRSRAGMASATIVFDNSDGWLPIDFSEVGITRRAYRDGDNEYLLNGQRVRLKDISELLAQSGLAERTYTVIGQGLVDAALSLKAEERRRLFEEAAGIGLHRSRRDEALRRLDTTRRNLERVQDILAELQPRLRSLERQAKRAQEYEQVRADLKVLLREWYGYHWHLAQAEMTDAKEAARHQEELLEKARFEQLEIDQKLAIIRGQSKDLRDQIRVWNLKLATAYEQREQFTREQAVNEERLRSIEIQLSGGKTEILRLQDEIGFYQQQFDVSKAEITNLELEFSEAEQKLTESKQKFEEKRNIINNLEKELLVARHEITTLKTQQSVLQAQKDERTSALIRYEASLNEADVGLKEAETQLSVINSSLEGATAQLHIDDRQLHDATIALQGNRNLISQLEALSREKKEKMNSVKSRVAQLQIQLDLLRQAESNLIGYADGARLLLNEIREARIPGAHGIFGKDIEVAAEFESAVASALGEYLGVVLVDGWNGLEKALDVLDKNSVRGALLVLTAIKTPKTLNVDNDKLPVESGEILGIASRVVKVREELRPVVDLLLGQVLIVRDRNTAWNLLSTGDWSNFSNIRIVTQKGEVFYPNGSVLSSSSGKGILGRKRQLTELREEIYKENQALIGINVSTSDIEKKLVEASANEKQLLIDYQNAAQAQKKSSEEVSRFELLVEKAKREYAWQLDKVEQINGEIQQARISETEINKNLISNSEEIANAITILRDKTTQFDALSIDDLRAVVSYWQTQSAVSQRALNDANYYKQERFETLKRSLILEQELQNRTTAMAEEKDSLIAMRLSLTDNLVHLNQEIENIRTLVVPAEDDLVQVEKTLNQLLTADMNARQTLSNAEHQYAQARIHFSGRQESMDTLRRRIEDDFGLVAFEYSEAASGPKPLPLDGMVDELPTILQIAPDLEENVQRQRALIRRMGQVNPEAQIEYQQVKDRFEFLSSQVTDLHEAEANIQEVIAELDLIMEREFRKTFEAVAQEFRHIFTRLFGGGMAKLVLTDPDDMTATGIDIEARLPGRRDQGLSLLSGGERSLAAAALVFALLRISPTTFCILDEVDAMLDESNVGRFRELLLELSAQTQFIIITHNRNTVQAASVIYGVTMGRDSASQVISLRLDELSDEYGVQHRNVQ